MVFFCCFVLVCFVFFSSYETARAHRNLVYSCSRMNTLFKRISILTVPEWDQFFLFSPLRRPGILWSLFKRKSLSRILPWRFICSMWFRTEKKHWNDFLIYLINLFSVYFIRSIFIDSFLQAVLLWSSVITHTHQSNFLLTRTDL